MIAEDYANLNWSFWGKIRRIDHNSISFNCHGPDPWNPCWHHPHTGNPQHPPFARSPREQMRLQSKASSATNQVYEGNRWASQTNVASHPGAGKGGWQSSNSTPRIDSFLELVNIGMIFEPNVELHEGLQCPLRAWVAVGGNVESTCIGMRTVWQTFEPSQQM